MAERVLVTGARAPVALHLARLLHAAGHTVLTADTPTHALTRGSKSVAKHLALPPPALDPRTYGRAIRRIVEDHAIDVVIPTCEEVFWLAFVWRDDPPAARLLAPDVATLGAAHDKHRFIGTARDAGLEVPETWRIDSEAALAAHAAHARDLVFKPVFSRFAKHTLVRPSREVLAKIRPTAVVPWVAQAFIAGEEICVHAFVQAGRVVAVAAYRPVHRAGKGAGIYFEPVEDAAVVDIVARFAAATGWSGHLSFDCIRRADGVVLPIECNPRPTSGLHFFRDGPAYAAALLAGDSTVSPDLARPLTVPLALWLYGFPKALRAGRVAAFRADLAKAGDALAWPGDPLPLARQARLVAEFAGVAIRRRMSLQEASTFDIEWNGEAVSTV